MKDNKNMKIFKELFPYVITILLVVLIRSFIVTPIRVNGQSMDKTLQNGEIMLLKKFDKSIERFDIVVLKYDGEYLIKRVIGLPGDKVKYRNNKLYINDKYYSENFLGKAVKTYDYTLNEEIPEGYYFVLGDNRTNSLDSRMIGLVSEKNIKGTTNFVLYPFNKFGSVK